MSDRKTVLVTGGGGMVGRNVCEHPDAASWTVLAPRRAELDLTDGRAVAEYVAAHQPDAVIHAAGRVGGIQANMAHPVAYLEENVAIGRNVIMAAYNAGTETLINLGSSCMYPREAPYPLREDMILTSAMEPTNEGYALAKVVAMRLCDYIRREKPSTQYKTIIPCNLYGPHDKFDPKNSHLLPAIIHKIHGAKTSGARAVEIWGDGTARREFIYAGDLAGALWKAAADPAALEGAMNIGLGYDLAINAYYEMVAEVLGWQGRFTHDLSKPVGMKQKLSSIERLTAWGWTPPTDLRAGIAQTYAHYLAHVAS